LPSSPRGFLKRALSRSLTLTARLIRTRRCALRFLWCLASAGPPVALRHAHRVENLREAEIDETFFEIDANHLHLDAIAEPIDAPVALAAQKMRAVHKPVVVVGHRRHVHHAFDEVLDELDVQAERADARDVALEFIADFVSHE